MTAIWGDGNDYLDTVDTNAGYGFATNYPLGRTSPRPSHTTDYNAVFNGGNPYIKTQSVFGRLKSDFGKYWSRPWVNDPTRAVWDEKTQLWYAWYISNGDEDHIDGTWAEIVSPDLVNWVESDFRFYTKNNDMGTSLWGGSVIVDHNNTAGFGKGAAIYFITMPGGVPESAYQCSTRWVAPRLGCSPTYDKIIMDNNGPSNDPNNPVRAPGQDFRDTRVDWDEDHGYWVMKLTVGYGISFYSSTDTETWTYLSTIDLSEWQQIETPDLQKIKTEDGEWKWVLAFSMKSWEGKYAERCGYMIGNWDGKTFTPDVPHPYLLCSGPDYYAQAMFQKDGKLYSWGWMCNWDYAGNGATSGYTNSLTTVVQHTVKRWSDTHYRLTYNVLPNHFRLYDRLFSYFPGWLWPRDTFTSPDTSPGLSYRYDVFLQKTSGGWGGPITFDFGVSNDEKYYTRLIVDPDAGTGTFSRKQSGTSFLTTNKGPHDAFFEDVDFTIDPKNPSLEIYFIVDSNGVEIIINNQAYISASLFLQQGPKKFRIINNANRPFEIARIDYRL